MEEHNCSKELRYSTDSTGRYEGACSKCDYKIIIPNPIQNMMELFTLKNRLATIVEIHNIGKTGTQPTG